MPVAAPSAQAGRQGPPPLSVVMPVHNALPYLDEAIESVLGQTFQNFEFVILDDASTDGSTERLRHWATVDERIRLIEVAENLGPARSSDTVARAASASIVARMDADDISWPNRLSEQLDLLRQHPSVGLVAALFDTIDPDGTRICPPEPWRLARPSAMVPFAHGVIMYRREVFDAVGGYRNECEYWEDQDLIARMASHSGALVIPQPLYSVRQTLTSTRIVSGQRAMEDSLNRMYRCGSIQSMEHPDDAHPQLAGAPTEIDPRVFISMGSPILWAGGRPQLFIRLLNRGRLGAEPATAAVLLWTAWASVSPSTLRGFLRALRKWRLFRARSVGADGRAVPWTPTRRAGR